VALPYYPRAEFARFGLSKVALDYLEGLRTELQTAVDSGDTASVDLTAILARLDAVEALAAEALRSAIQAHLLDMVPLTRDEILAIVDTAILAETGDDLLDETGDSLLLESA
jgi:hypothetical protein